MAHIAKYGRSAIGHMLDHYARDHEATLERDNVHESETGRNYALAYTSEGDMGTFEPRRLKRAVKNRITRAVQVHEQNTGKKLRKDGVVMADAVVTLPEDWPDDRDPQEFFMVALSFMRERYGSSCVNGGFVHMDETTPHMHVPIIPLMDPEGTDKARLCAKKKISRTDLRSFHKDLQSCLKEHGLPGTVGGLRKDGMPKWTSKLTQDELQDYKESLDVAKRKGIALGRSESLSKVTELKNRVDALEKENQGLRANLVGIERELNLSEFIFDEETETLADAARHFQEWVNSEQQARLEAQKEARRLQSQLTNTAEQSKAAQVERQTDARRIAAAQPVRSGVHRKQPAQPVVDVPSNDDSYGLG